MAARMRVFTHVDEERERVVVTYADSGKCRGGTVLHNVSPIQAFLDREQAEQWLGWK